MIQAILIICIYCLIAVFVSALLCMLYKYQCKAKYGDEEMNNRERLALIFMGVLWPFLLIVLILSIPYYGFSNLVKRWIKCK